MAVAKLKAGTGNVKITPVGHTGTGDITISVGTAATTAGTSHTLVSGTAFAPSATRTTFVQCWASHVGTVTWQLLNAATTTVIKFCTALTTVIVGQSFVAMVPPGYKVKITLAASATVTPLKVQTF